MVPVNVIKMEILQKESYKFKSLSLVRRDDASCACLAADLMGAGKKGKEKKKNISVQQVRTLILDEELVRRQIRSELRAAGL